MGLGIHRHARVVVWLLIASAAGCASDREPGSQAPDNPEAPAAAGPGLLTEITTEAGIPGPSAAWPDGTWLLPEIMQGGVGLFDYDGDGDLDILHVRVPPPGRHDEPAPNVLYRREPDGTYRDVTAEAGIGDPGFGQGVAIGDVDNDGDADVYFTNYGPDAFYRNNGDGTFSEATAAAGFSGDRWSSSAAFFDYDRDGFLDLFVLHYLRFDPDTACQDPMGRREYCSPGAFAGEPDRLYRNDGDGTFTDVTEAAGLIPADGGLRSKGLGLICADLSGDDLVDVYVANDQESNQLWVNNGDGSFSEQAILRGVAVNEHGKAEASMGVVVGDLNGDAVLDLYMTHLAQEHNTLYTGGRSVLFTDSTRESRLAAHDAAFTGFGCGLLDLDHDGDLDIAVANGRVSRGAVVPGAALGEFWNRYAEPNLLFENDGAGGFENVSPRAGAFASRVEVARGLAVGDLDGDGDLDLATSNVDNTLRLYRNDAVPAGRHWLIVVPRSRGRAALGARVVLQAGGRPRLGLALAAVSYASSSDPRVHFGLGEVERAEHAEVTWPDGTRERFAIGEVDRVVELVQGGGDAP